MKRRAVVTGIGAVTPFGQGTSIFNTALRESQTAFINYIPDKTYFDKEFTLTTKKCGRIAEWHFTPPRYVKLRKYNSFHKAQVWILIACFEALGSGNFNCLSIPSHRIGIINASDLYHLYSLENLEKQQKVETNTSSAISNILSVCLRIKGPTLSIASGEASGLFAVGAAYELICTNRCDMVIVTAGSQLNNAIRWGYEKLNYLSQPPDESVRPFDKNRNGTVLSEGAGCLVIESLSSAKKRNKKILGEIGGYGTAASSNVKADFNDIAVTVESSMALALDDAAISKNEIDLINAHANGHPVLDKSEALAIKSEFGSELPVSAVKSIFGESLNPSGLFNVISILESFETGLIAPTINCQYPEITLNISDRIRTGKIEKAITNSITYNGGESISLVMQKYRE